LQSQVLVCAAELQQKSACNDRKEKTVAKNSHTRNLCTKRFWAAASALATFFAE
jgi:hypothetical protein